MKTFHITFSKCIFLIAVLIGSITTAQAQINITSDQFLQVFSQLASTTSINYQDTSTAGLQALVNQSGVNQTWDFQTLPFALDTSNSNIPSNIVTYPGGAPLADSFPTATHVSISEQNGTRDYTFFRIDQTGFYVLGAVSVQNGVALLEGSFSPPEEAYAFPLTYQTSWGGTSTLASGKYSEIQETDNFVDGWGTFILPGNISTQALRIRTKTTDISPSIIIGIDTLPADTEVSYSYQWFALSAYFATIDADANQNPTQATYTIPGTPNIVLNNPSHNESALTIGSDPVSSQTNISFTQPSESQVRISLTDPLGRESRLLMNGLAHPGLNTLLLDPANLVSGTYFLRMEADGYSSVQKMIVAH